MLALEGPDRASITGLSAAEIASLRDAKLSDAELARVFRVRLPDADVAISGRYAISSGRIDFTPSFPFDRGREYTIELFGDRLARPGLPPVVTKTMALPSETGKAAEADAAPTRVIAIEPAAGVWPANILRAYIYFSGPMSSESGVGHITLRDATGAEIAGAFVPLEADYFNPEHTRYTLFFDPGRVKRGILPNRQLGRALVAGRKYTLEVSAAWHDARRRPLAADFRREFQAGPAVEAPLRVDDWRLSDVVAGSTAPLAVTFPWAIDRPLAEHALLVNRPNGRTIEGQVRFEDGNRRWIFTPASAWVAGVYRLVAQPALEDASGNQVNRAFEVDMNKAPAAASTAPQARTFVVK